MTGVSSLCVYCGSRVGNDPDYANAARELGSEMAQRGIRLVFGAGSIGIMGLVAEAVNAGGGAVTGIIPDFLDQREVGMRNVREFIVTPSMHVRKAKMFERSDAFVTLPGGLGSLDETFEIITWRQLDLHNKPIIIVNINGYWDPLIALIDSTIERGFAAADAHNLYTVVNDVPGIFQALEEETATASSHYDTSRF